MQRTLAYGTLLCLMTAGPAAAQYTRDVRPAGGNPFFLDAPPWPSETAPVVQTSGLRPRAPANCPPGVATITCPPATDPCGPAPCGPVPGYGPAGNPCANPCASGLVLLPDGTVVGPDGSTVGVRPPESKIPWHDRWDPCTPPPHLWFWGEYLLWHVSNGSLPNGLVATSPADSIASLIADSIGLTNPAGRNAEYGMSSGLRVAVGHWGGPCMRFGAELGFLFLEHKPDQFTVASDPSGNPIVLRPFTNAATFAPDFAVVAAPGAAAGSVVVSSINRLWGSEVNGAFRFIVEPDWYLTPIIGIRYLDFQEDLDISQTTALIGQGVGAFRGQQVGAPGVIVVTDHFGARTQFFGGQLGGRLGVRENRLTVEAYWKVAIGWSHMATDVAGSTALRGLGPPAVSPGGLLAVPSNSGHFTADDLAVVPEFGLQAGYDVTRWFRVTAGYSAMFWSRVVRPGSQVSTIVSPAQVPSSLQFGQPGPSVPPSALVRDVLWLNGVSFGAVFRY